MSRGKTGRASGEKLSAKERKKLMDGARFWSELDVPEDYMTDPLTGLRPGETVAPKGDVTVRLAQTGVSNTCVLPTRAKWRAGHWLTDESGFVGTDDYYTWVVDAEGTPGNYEQRLYVLPPEKATGKTPPVHPADWKKPPKTSYGSGTYSTNQSKKPQTSAPTLPYSIRLQCPGCGHWYKENEVKVHAQVCPTSEGGVAMWAIECSCPCRSLDETAKIKPGFPKKPPVAAEEGEKDAAAGSV